MKWTAKNPPRFEDFLVSEAWQRTAAPVKIMSRSEHLYRTRLTNAGKEPPNFAGHYRYVQWGCGSEGISGAVVDLRTGEEFSPPLSTGPNHVSGRETTHDKPVHDF